VYIQSSLKEAVWAEEPPAGAIRNVLIRNVVAHGMGSSMIHGHPDSWLDNVSIENLKLFVSNAPESPLPSAGAGVRGEPVAQFTNVDHAAVRNAKARAGSSVFLNVSGSSRGIRLSGNDLEGAEVPYRLDAGVKSDAVRVAQ
jgi:hypothetical protein